MKRILATSLILIVLASVTISQTTQQPARQPEAGQEEVIRISTALVQTDVVVTNKNDQVIPDLKLSDFELYENGKRQTIKFMEFVSVDTGRRSEGVRPSVVPEEISREPGAQDLKRVFAFVVDDLTVPFQDLVYVRQALTDFVDNQMQAGDLVAIVRTVGGKGLLQQFTSDRQLLRRAIAQLNLVTNPFQAHTNRGFELPSGVATPAAGEIMTGEVSGDDVSFMEGQDIGATDDETARLFRGLISLQTASYLIDSLKQIPGRKSLVLISGGIPIFEMGSSGSQYSNVTGLLQQITDNAIRAGVVINTLDPRGLRASPGVASFVDTPAKSALGVATAPDFGRGGSEALGPTLAGGEERVGLNTLSSATGGISIANMNNLKTGLEKVLSRSRGYYLLGYTPEDKFDNKFRKILVRVKRDGLRVYSHSGYLARDEKPASEARTKEQLILEAAKSPLARRDVDVAANVGYKLTAANKAAVDFNLLIEAKKLNFTQTAEGRHQASFDVAGFLYDQLGKLRGGFSETVTTNLTAQDYQRALKEGLNYSANTEVPAGYYQFRAVVHEAGTGKLGTMSRYLEIPNLSNRRLAASTIYLSAVDPSGANAQPMQGLRQLSRKQELRYALAIYNAKADNNRVAVRTQLIISQGGNTLLKEPEQEVDVTDPTRVIKMGQLGVSRVRPGRYVLTLLVTDPLADKKHRTITRSIDFTVTN